jgi:hypothetical protein
MGVLARRALRSAPRCTLSRTVRALRLGGFVALGSACGSGGGYSADSGDPGTGDSATGGASTAGRGGPTGTNSSSGGGAGGSGGVGEVEAGGNGGAGGSGGAAAGGSGGSGGTGGAAGAGASGEAGTDSGSTSANPFACKFAWGEPEPSGSLSSYTWLQFMTSWAGYEIQANGSINTFDNGGFLSSLATTNLIGAYYGYLIGYYGHVNGLPDQNDCAGGVACTAIQPNLTTGAAYLLLSDPTGANAPCNSTTTFCADNLIVKAYAYYAQQTHAAWPTRPFIWLIEGDFMQYTDTTQVASLTSTTGTAAGLSYAQLGRLAALIATAIKSNMPNAIVAFDDSAWVADTIRPLYWSGIMAANTDFDMVWTTGVGNNPPFLNAGETASSYDGTTGTYSWLHTYTGRTILVDESAGASLQEDTWSNQSAATIHALIADGVVAVNVSDPPSEYEVNVTALEPQLNPTCP